MPADPLADTYGPERLIACAGCGAILRAAEAVWIDTKTKAATMDGQPFHPECADNEYD